MSKYEKNQSVEFKIGALTLIGKIANVISIDAWAKDKNGQPTKIHKFVYQVFFWSKPFEQVAEVDESNIVGTIY